MRAYRSVERAALGDASFRDAPAMPTPLLGAAALEGAPGLALAGGWDVTHPDLARGLRGDVLALDPDALAWRVAATLDVARYLHRAARVDASRWVIAGGLRLGADRYYVATGATEVVDLAAGAARRVDDAPFAAAEPLVAPLPGGRVLVAGGYDDDAVVRRAAVLDVATGRWTAAPDLPAPLAGAQGPFELDARHALWLGGVRGFDPALPDAPSLAHVFDADALRFTEVDLPVRPGACVVALAPGRLLVAGGYDARGDLVADVDLVEITAPAPSRT